MSTLEKLRVEAGSSMAPNEEPVAQEQDFIGISSPPWQ
jgi:hypothetical protein